MFFGRRPGVAFVSASLVLLAGCSSDDSVAAPVSVPDSATVSLPNVDGADVSTPAVDDADARSDAPSSEGGDEGDDADTADGPPATAEPLRPVGEPPPSTLPDPNSTSAYISRRSMTSQAIEVHWSNTEGVAEYHIHRVLRTSDSKPPVEAMTADNRIHVSSAGGRFADENVVAGAEYWHGVREFSADGELTAHGWHQTAAVDDEQPPSVVDGITAVVEDGEVLVTWTEPDENYQLHAYRVLRGVDGEPPESMATTWRLDQRSFIDDDPPTSAEVVYEVVAMDFHWNQSSPGGVTIDLS